MNQDFKEGVGMSQIRVLITGGSGFIGSHLADALVSQGHQVSAIDNLSTGRLENIRHLLGKSNFHFARANITDEIVLDICGDLDIPIISNFPVGTVITRQRYRSRMR